MTIAEKTTIVRLERAAMWWERVTDAVDAAEVMSRHDAPAPLSDHQVFTLLADLRAAGLVVQIDGGDSIAAPAWRLA